MNNNRNTGNLSRLQTLKLFKFLHVNNNILHNLSGDCEVFLDLLDVDGIKDMGMHSWIQEKIELAQFVVILCSTGARFKCAKNRQFKMKQERQVTCYIAHVL